MDDVSEGAMTRGRAEQIASQRSQEATCRELMRRAGDLLARERAFSLQDARCCLYELAQARKHFLAEVAAAILAERHIAT